MRTANTLATILLLVGSLVPASAPAWGQATSGEITGKVADASGAVIPGTEVSAMNAATGTSRTVVTSATGVYRIPLLPPGTYAVKAALTGFKTALRDGVKVTVGEVIHVDFTLEVGAISETVTVTEATEGVNVEQGRVSTLVDSKLIVDMPLNGRNVYQLMQLAPGAVNTQSTVQEPGTGLGNVFTTSINGGRINYNGFWLDGISNKSLSGGTNITPSADSIQEFRMETLNFSPEFGDSSGSVVNVVSKSGTNNLHGTLYEFHRNDNLDAREFFDKVKPEFKRNQFGATVGGPIRKNSTFFFASYEGTRIRTGESLVQTFESPQWASFAKTYGSPVAKYLYANHPAPLITSVTNTVGDYLEGQGFIGSATQAAVDAFAGSTFGAPAGALKVDDPIQGETSFFTPDVTDANQVSGRIDQEFRGGKDKLFGRYYYDRIPGFQFVDPRPAFSSPNIVTANQLSLSETHVFSPNILNEFRAGLNRNNLNIVAGTPGVPQIVDGAAGVTSFGAYNGYPQSFIENVFNYSNVLSISKGNHGMKAGVEFRRNQENSEFNVGRPSYTFYGLVYLALDDPYYQVGGVNPHIVDGTHQAELSSNFRGWRSSEAGFFFNDDWKIRPNLTLNLGMRFDLYTRLKEVQERATKYDLTNGANIFERVRRGDFAATDALSEGDHNNFAPRVGFAWDPFGKGKMSVRGGFGIAFQSGIYNPLANSRWNPPYYSFNLICAFAACGRPSEVVLYGPQTPGQAVTPGGPNPNPGAGTFEGNIIAYEPTNNNSNYLSGIPNPRMRDPYVMSFFFGIQRELRRDLTLEVNYVGTSGRKIIRAENFNRFPGDRIGAASPTGEFAGDASRNGVNPKYGTLRFWENSVNSSYHSLQTQVNKRFSKGYAVGANYTWSKSLDVRSTWHSGATTSNLGQEGYSTDIFDQALDRGRSIFDARHRFILNYQWDLPFMKDSPMLLRAVLGAWQLNGIVALQSGQPFTPFHSSAFPAGDFNADGVNNDRPNTPSSGNSISSERSSWVNPGAGPFKIPTTNSTGIPSTAEKVAFFGRPANGTVGTLGRNTFDGPGFANTDFSVFKNFPLSGLNEEAKLQFRFEFFNAFNRVNFWQPEPRLNNAQFGRPIQTFDARQIQIGIKFIF